MDSELIAILIGVAIVGVGTYRMWRLRNSSRKYVISTMVGIAMLLAAFPIRESFRLLADILAISGILIASISLYMNYKHRTSSNKKRR